MNAADIGVVLVAAALIAGLARFFFGPKQSHRAELRAGVQEITVTVKGGYSPDFVRVRQGVPVRITFDRQEAGDCTARVVFPDLGLSKSLPAFTRTVLEFIPERAGTFGFACGMNMIHGTLLVDPAEAAPSPVAEPAGEPMEPEFGGDRHTHGAHTHEVARAVGLGPTTDVDALATVEFRLVADGVSCPTCVANIEAALAAVGGVDRVDVNYGAERVTVAFDPSQVSRESLAATVRRAGYRVAERSEPGSSATEDTEAAERRAEIADLARRVLVSA
ncbi:MAG TPA: cupredoxin domain-containing protein, partial [Acidimicrobiales bacterium]|nr:cupredoxin domain-containing protein [Acidimicrobiales bacterium]